MRRRLLWLLVAPLGLGASQCAHWLAYRLVAPDAHERAQLLAETGHAYLAYAPALAGVAGALVLAALAGRASAAARGSDPGSHRRLAAWPFALIPVVAFALQEHVERLAHDGAVPLHAYAERSFLIGLVLQLPFGAAAYLLARLLLAAAVRAGRLLAPPPRARTAMAPALRARSVVHAPRAASPAEPGFGRGPPRALPA